MIDPAVIHASAARGDTRYPHAAWLPIPEQQTQPLIKPTQLIWHSMAAPRLTSLEALRIYMGRDDVHIESTGATDLDGRVAQFVDANRRADCNYKANPRAISFETQDEGSPTLASTPWSPPQLEQHAGITAWCNLRFGIPIELPSSWDDPGVGYHRLYPEWSTYVGKTCPGDARVAQFPALFRRAREIVTWTPPQEDDMPAQLLYVALPPTELDPGQDDLPWIGRYDNGVVVVMTNEDAFPESLKRVLPRRQYINLAHNAGCGDLVPAS